MASEILINVGVGEIRVALVVDGRLEDYSCERLLGGAVRGNLSRLGDIVLGRVQRVMPGMQAAFIEIGMPRAGFLALREARALSGPDDTDIGISDCVREGDAILVQIIKDPIGEKGARLSADISLPGRLLVMTPGKPGLTLSRRVDDQAQRALLQQLGEPLLNDPQLTSNAGYIFRTVAQGASLEELKQDALALGEIWRGIDEKRKTARPPALLHHDLGLIERTLRDAVRGDVARVLIDNAAATEAARDYCRRAMPGVETKIEYIDEDLFQRHDLEEEIGRLSEPRVMLPSGGWITIEPTEALTAIDVNSGSHADASGLEATALAVNREAASEMGRQIRLRGIGGLIVADFIQMTTLEHREQVLAALVQGLSADRIPVQLSALWDLGIVAITRKRVRESFVRQTSEACAVCGGVGRVPTAETVVQTILRQVEREARAWPGRALVVTAAPSVAAWLTELDATELLARHGIGRVRIETGTLARGAFDVRPV